MAYETLQTEQRDDGIHILRLSRPDQMNAFTVQMANELEDFFRRANDDDSIRAIVVTGEGKAFCAGMDLSAEGNVFGLDESMEPTLADMDSKLEDPAFLKGVRDTGGRVTLAIYDCRKPVIAAINGAAVGIGATMTLAMDARMASEKARIGFVFGRLGIVPEACSSWFLPRIVGITQALDWVYTGRVFDAEEASSAGLVSRVVAPDELLETAMDMARAIVDRASAVSLGASRQLLWSMLGASSPWEAHRRDSRLIYELGQGADAREGVQSFLEKRAPEFEMTVPEDYPHYLPSFPDADRID